MKQSSQNLAEAVEAGGLSNEERRRMEPVARARFCPPEFRSPTASFLTGLVAGMALSSAILLVGVTL